MGKTPKGNRFVVEWYEEKTTRANPRMPFKVSRRSAYSNYNWFFRGLIRIFNKCGMIERIIGA